MEIIKNGTIKVPTQPKDYDLQATGLVFKSYDNQIALTFDVKKQDGTPADLLGATLRLLMYVYDEVDGTVTKEPVPFITKNLITESFLNGRVKYILPEALKAYNGIVETYVYIEHPDGTTSDNIGFTFRMKRSEIDGLAQDKADYFIEDFQQLLDGVKQEATDAVNETLAKVEASSTAKMQELEAEVKRLTEHANQKITEYDQYIASGKSDWEDFVNRNREIIESVDPGGTILSEIINATGNFEKLADRVATAQTYQDFEELNLINPQVGQSYTVVNNGNPQKYKILTEGFPNGFSVVDLGNGKYAHRYFDSYNEWLQGLKQKNFAAHKGFNATSNQAKLAGAYPGNTIRAFEEAGKLGFGMVELDIQNCLDDWLVIHDGNTATLEHGSETELISGLTAAEITSRKLVKEYVTSGYYWNYSETSSGYSVPLLKDVLAVCKKYGMYVLVEIKATSATDAQIENLATIIRQSGMEERCIIFGSYPDLNMRTLKLLPNAIYGSVVGTDSDERLINLAKSFKNHFVTINSTSSDATFRFLKDNGIPFGVWTIDNYQQAEEAFNKGAMTVTTDRLMMRPSLEKYSLVNEFKKSDILSVFKNNGSTGSTTVDSDGDILVNATERYFSKTLTLPINALKTGQIIRVKCTAKTNSASPATNVGRIYFNNGGSASAMTLIEDVLRFDANYYQTKEMAFVVGDGNVLNNLTLSVGLAGQGILGSGEMEIKEFSLEIYAPKSEDTSRERYGYIFAYDIPPAIRPEMAISGITNVSVKSDDPSTILVDYVPFFDQTKKPIVLTDVDAYGQKIMRQVKVKSLDSPHGQLAINIYEPDGTKIPDVRTGMRMGFAILIKI